jgi:hypothetical protein
MQGRTKPSLKDSLEAKLHHVRVRCGVNVLLVQAALVLAIAGAAAAVAVAAERLLAVPVISLPAIYGAAGAAVLLIAALSLFRTPDRMQVAVLMDERLAFHERFSTALALADDEDPFAQAATREAHETARRLNVSGQFPVKLTRHWYGTATAWAIAAAAFFAMPTVDVLGYLARNKAEQAKADELQQAKVAVREQAGKVRTAVQQLNNKVLEGELDKMSEIAKGARPDEVRREAIRKLTDLAEQMRKMQQAGPLQAAKRAEQMLKGLRNSPNALSPELTNALAGGDFAKAAKMLREMTDKLNNDQLSEKEKKALSDQLKDLAGQLDGLADAQKQNKDMLEQEGLDGETAKKLAGMSGKDLREALKKQGLTDEQIDELLDKMSQNSQAAGNCQSLSKALAKCSGLSGELMPGGLIGLIESLDSMEATDGEIGDLEDAMAVIEGAIAELGEGGDLAGLCEGEGDGNGAGLWAAGDGNKTGKGQGGGRARAWGARPTGEPEDVGQKKTGVKNKPSKGPIIASWLFKGPQAKGVSKRELSEVVQAAKDSAAEAIRDSKIPRKYEGPVKSYFGDFEKRAGAGEPETPKKP